MMSSPLGVLTAVVLSCVVSGLVGAAPLRDACDTRRPSCHLALGTPVAHVSCCLVREQSYATHLRTSIVSLPGIEGFLHCERCFFH